MAPSTRKRAAPPPPAANAAADAEAPASKRPKRTAKQTGASDISNEETTTINAKSKSKIKAKGNATDPDEEVQDREVPKKSKTKANGQKKTKVDLADGEAPTSQAKATEKSSKPSTRGRGKTATQPATADADGDANGDDDGGAPENQTTSTKPAKRSTKGKGQARANEPPDEDDDVTANATAPAKKGKAPSKGKGKAKVKEEPEDDAKVKDEEQADAGAAVDDAAPKVSDAQFAKSSNLRIPLDEECHMGAYKVHVDDSNGIIYDAALNQTNAAGNNNKFYKIQLLTNGQGFHTWTRWGRVGERGQSATLGTGSFQDALKNFDKKFKDKTGLKWDDRGSQPLKGKYVFVEKSYEPDSDEEEESSRSKGNGASRASPPKCTLEAPVKSLMEMIFNQEYFEQAMQDLNYDAQKMPLGKLSKATISRGYQTLKDLSALLNDPSLAQTQHDSSYNAAVEQLSNLYYSYIPHDFGRMRPPIIQSHDQLKREIDLMDSLTDLKDADQIIKAEKDDIDPVHPLDSRFNGLGMQEMTPIDSDSQEFKEISQYLVKTCGSTHSVNYEVRDVFRIERLGETDRFEQSNFAKIKSDRRLLWHGSRATNYGGILSQGLRIAPPEAPVSGYMFGKGIYLADLSSKSANYCCSYISGGEVLLLLCEAELGQPMQTLTNASYNAGEDALQKGMWSTWGQGSTGPKGWKDAACVHPSLAGVSMPDTTQSPGKTGVKGAGLLYNEYICYDVAQVRLRYLLRVKV